LDAPSKIIPIVPAPATPATPEEVSLYEISRKIYPRAVHGWFAGWRWALVWLTQIVYYGLPWLEWNGRQAVLFELAARKFYIFGLVFWPQDVIYLTVLLILSAYALFLFTAVAGRLERKIEGDRVARIRLDGEPLSARKFGKKAAKHAVWAAIGLWTGITFVGYFTPIRELVPAIPFALGPWETFWILFYGFATYGNAGWMREQVCKYMCPYARFQSVMFDKDTMIIAYDEERGEPRGARSRKVDPKEKGLGHCVDCEICVQVCPTGIDIRKGLQYECIGCAACIDGCNQVMDKMGYPHGLIRYASQNALTQHFGAKEMWKHVFRTRTLIYTGILLAIMTAASVSLALRNPLKVDVLRDRGALARESQAGLIENVYRLQIMNTTEAPHAFTIRASGLPGIAVVGVEQPVKIEGAAVQTVPIRLQAPADAAPPGPHKIEIHVQAIDDASMKRDERSTFILPRL
jgi:cytochrome c oxidase accessory protein FixG